MCATCQAGHDANAGKTGCDACAAGTASAGGGASCVACDGLDGREVAVKVQYPDIEHIVKTDLSSVRRICWIYEKFDPQPMALLPLLDEMNEHLALELDFCREVESGDRIRSLFEENSAVLIPEFYKEWCTGRVITMEFMSGVKVTDLEALKGAGIDYQQIVQGLMGIYTKKILACGFFQADPHPGNIFIQPGPRFVLVDFGLAKVREAAHQQRGQPAKKITGPGMVCGTPERAIAQIKELKKQLGHGRMNLNIKVGNTPDAAVLHCMKLLRDVVFPDVRDV